MSSPRTEEPTADERALLHNSVPPKEGEDDGDSRAGSRDCEG